MSVLEKIQNGWAFKCPGCNDIHQIDERWTFNGNEAKPTFSPSLLVTYPANPKASEEFAEWRQERICHSFITDGVIKFLYDCTHKLAGKHVALKEFSWD